ncbi:IclR family transcriptional regulator [Bacillus sp. M6-12]|uniref:IclR family transcriptional regulator n=1 Tax=Bacillus sp. M6-12 TaxID=2054166 RepID=UPI000C782ED3|nr:IclR family transcriptional regulator [Bacillus sp. M6-12]PLS18608.1 IclR family transcriptional regulator [Bacillus sp. M6-12]
MRDIKVEPIRAIERIISILNCFSFEKVNLTIECIVEQTGLAKATVYRMLWTLEKNGLIYYENKDHTYRLGYKFLEYGGIVLENLDIRREAEPVLSELHQTTGLTILLAIPQKNVIQYLLSIDSNDEFPLRSYAGRSRALHYGALGIMLLAQMPITEVKTILNDTPLEKRTPYTLIDQEIFIRRLQTIKEQGLFVDIDETFVGLTGISVPVFGLNGQTVAAIGVIGPSHKMEFHDRERLIKMTKKAANEISQKLGYLTEIY